MRCDEDVTHMQDLAWVHAVQQRDDRAAFSSLVRRHQSFIRLVLRRLCHGNAGIADELAQETLLQAYRSLPGFRGESRFRTWLYRLTYNVYLQHRRSLDEQFQDKLEVLESGIEADESSPAVANIVALNLDLKRALARLSEAERLAIVYCHLAELSHSETADLLGWPLGTVKTHVLRGKQKLRDLLAAWAPSSHKGDCL